MNAQQKKILNFLNDVYLSTKDDYSKVTLQSFIKKHRVSLRYGQLLKENFLDYKHSGLNNSSQLYKWKSIKPNLKMVDKSISEVRLKNSISMSINKNQNQLKKGNAKNRLAFVKELRDVCLTKYAEMPTGSIITMREKHNVDLDFTNFLFSNKYFLRKMSYNNEIGVNCYVYRWNNTRSSMQLKKLILKADDNVIELIKKIDNKPKVKSDTHREKVIKEKEKEIRYKSISILWGLIKIKY
jgi:hypothetical protein